MTAVQEAITRYRTLAAAQPDVFAPNLALALDSLGIFQNAVGQPEAFRPHLEEPLSKPWWKRLISIQWS